ncbi:hypothetical protein ACLOJK_038484 [Asimina triloba]
MGQLMELSHELRLQVPVAHEDFYTRRLGLITAGSYKQPPLCSSQCAVSPPTRLLSSYLANLSVLLGLRPLSTVEQPAAATATALFFLVMPSRCRLTADPSSKKLPNSF